jgi:hypothetical protein
VPAILISALGIEACNCEALTYVVVRLAPFHRTTEPNVKFDPATVSTKPAPPAVAVAGEMELTVGAVPLAPSAITGIASRMAIHTKLSLDFDMTPPMQTKKG